MKPIDDPGPSEIGTSGQPAWSERWVTILGMARQGLALARYFIAAGAYVTLSDLRSAEQLVAAQEGLRRFAADCRTRGLAGHDPLYVLGEHPLSLLDRTNLLCLSGGVSPALPIVQAAVARGIALNNDALLTLAGCPAPIIGITGSAGKTTTTTLTGLILEADGAQVHVGGNIGTPLIDRLDEIQPGDKVVMELSSFQLELFDRSPALALITNITPNHLDRHPSMSHYAAAKANILRFQAPGDTCVLNADDRLTGHWLQKSYCDIPAGEGQAAVHFPLRARCIGFSIERELPEGAFLDGDRLIWRQRGQPDRLICRAGEVLLRGRHNLANILAAACLAGLAGADSAAMGSVAASFRGVEHRLEVVRQHRGVTWINDSIATAPERTMAALRAFAEPVVLLAGGRDKHLPWDELAEVAHARARHVVLFGEAAGLIQAALSRYAQAHPTAALPVTVCNDLAQAVAVALRAAQPGDVVLLSPGGTGFDAYQDFAARGQHFRSLVETLP